MRALAPGAKPQLDEEPLSTADAALYKLLNGSRSGPAYVEEGSTILHAGVFDYEIPFLYQKISRNYRFEYHYIEDPSDPPRDVRVAFPEPGRTTLKFSVRLTGDPHEGSILRWKVVAPEALVDPNPIGTSPSYAILPGAGEPVQYKIWDRGGQFFHVMAFGAKGDGVTDDTAAFNQALLAADASGGGAVFAPGTLSGYYIEGQITQPAGTDLCGSGWRTILHVKTLSAFVSTIFHEGNDCSTRNLQISFDQPDSTNIADIVHYKPAITPGVNSLLYNLKICGAWVGISGTYYGPSKMVIDILYMSAFSKGITLGNITDNVRIGNFHYAGEGLSNNNAQIFYSSGTSNIGIEIGQCDGLHLVDSMFLNAGIALNVGVDSNKPFVFCTGVELNGPSRINMLGGFLSFTNGLLYGGAGFGKVTQSGGLLQINSNIIVVWNPAPATSGGAMFDVSGGHLLAGVNTIYYENNGAADFTSFLCSAGSMDVVGNYFDRDTTTPTTFSKPTVSLTGTGSGTVTNNRSKPLTAGSFGTFASDTSSSGSLNRIANNKAKGWTKAVPASASSQDEAETISVTVPAGGVVQPFGNANNFSGSFLITDTNYTASTAAFLAGTGGVVKLGDTNSAFTITANTAGKANVYLNGNSAVELQNNYPAAITYTIYDIRTKASL